MKRFYKITALALSLLMCLALAACGPSTDTPPDSTASADPNGESAQTADDPKVITLTESWDFSLGIVPVLNPGNSSNYGAIYWGRNFYNTLVSYNAQGELVGELAERWEISEDGKSYTFYLRDGVKFSDGSPLTAEAVKLSYEAAVVNLGEYNGSFGLLSSLFGDIEVVDEGTLIVHLTNPYYGALNDMTMCCPLGIVNPVVFEGQDDLTYGDIFKTASFGTGPYLYEGDYEDNTYTFVRNPHYWGEAPDVDVFRVKVIEDNDSKLLALRSGEIDAVLGSNRISFDGYAELSADPSFHGGMHERSSLTRLLSMNVTNPPFNDVLVRQALAYTIDQSMLETAVFNGLETVADTMFPRTAPYCDVEQTIYETDLDKAKSLLEQAGWTDSDDDGIREKDGVPFEVDLNYQTSLSSIDNLALAVAARLLEVGIKVNVVPGDMMTFYAAMATTPLAIANTYGGAFEPTTLVTNMNPRVSTDPISMQFAAYFEEGILDELESTADDARVQEIYNHILTTIADESLLVPLTRAHELGIWNSEKIADYGFYVDSNYVVVSNIHLK
ncbi:MAG: ABC transporter substrate-binding protein [Christensenellales bacterium]|jgi:nickel transport system substrate-binding protein